MQVFGGIDEFGRDGGMDKVGESFVAVRDKIGEVCEELFEHVEFGC